MFRIIKMIKKRTQSDDTLAGGYKRKGRKYELFNCFSYWGVRNGEKADYLELWKWPAEETKVEAMLFIFL